MRTPAISVIIPCYNPKNYIKQCVRSVLRQTFRDIEVIVVDDGSTNQEWVSFIERLSKNDRRLQIVRNEHHGIALTRKAGYLLARGEYIFFMDCDDWLPNNALQILYQAARKSGADVTIGKYDRVADSFGLIPIKASAPKCEAVGKLIPKKDILKVCYGSLVGSVEDPVTMVVWGRLFRSSCIQQAIDEKYLFPVYRMEDYYFNLVLMPYISSLYMTNDIVYHYRNGGITSTTIDHTSDNGEFFNYRFDQFEKWNFQEGHPRTFAAFAAELYWDLKVIFLTGKYSRDEIIAYIYEQVSTYRIVNWAQNNIGQIEGLPNHFKMIATGSPEDVYKWCDDAFHTKSFKKHHFLKQCAIALSKVIDFVYEILH